MLINPEDHFGLVHYVLDKYFRMNDYSKDYEDHFQEGCVALVKACRNFSTDYQVEFSTYASRVIIGGIRRYKRDFRIIRNARVPFKIYLQLQKQDMLTASLEEICEKFGCSETVAKRALMHQYIVVSGESKLPDSNETLTYFDVLKGPALDYTEVEVNEFLKSLPDKEREVIHFRQQDLTQLEIAERLGVSQPSIGRVLRKVGNKYYKMRAEAIAN